MELDDLVLAVRRGDARAWTLLGRRLTDDLHCYFRPRVGEDRADDLTQNTLVNIHRNLDNFEIRPGQPFGSWVRAIARRQIQDEFRRQARRERLADALHRVERAPSITFGSRLDLVEYFEFVEQELAKLESPYRRILEHDLRGQDDDDFIAQCEGIKAGSVRTRRRRAQQRLRDRIHKRWK